MSCKVLAVKKSEFNDRFNAGQKVCGYMVTVALPNGHGFIEVWSSREVKVDDVVDLVITEGKNHRPKVKIA